MKEKLLIVFLAAGTLMLPLFLGNKYILHIGITAGMYMLLTLGLFLVTGLTGQMNLGQAAFWAVGAYSYSLAVIKLGWPTLLALIFAILVTVLLGLVLAIPSLKVSGVFFTMITVGFGEIVRIVLLNWRDLTGGGMGVRGIPKPNIFGMIIKTPQQFYILTIISVILCFLVTYRIIKSFGGLSLRATGSNETVSRAIGINVFSVKIIALIISSSFAAIAGMIYAGYNGFIHPDAFSSSQSYFLIQVLVIGGIHSLAGISIMTPILTYSLEYLRILDEYQMIVYAIVLILFLIFCPQGVGGLLKERYDALLLKREGNLYLNQKKGSDLNA